MEVRGRVALVTGAGARIGRAMALYLARERGMRVAVHCRDSTQGAEAAVAEIVSLGGEACVFRADLSRREDSQALVSRVSEHFCDVVSVLVNNASVFERDEWDSVSGSQWSRHMSVNLEAAYVLSRSLGEGLQEREAKGVIVNMLDQRVLRLTPHYVSYSVSKFGLFGLTQILAQAMAPRVRVVGLGLGQVLAGKQEETQEGEKAGERAGKQEGEGERAGEEGRERRRGFVFAEGALDSDGGGGELGGCLRGFGAGVGERLAHRADDCGRRRAASRLATRLAEV